MHFGRVAPGQCWLLDVPAVLRPAAGALCTLTYGEPHSRHKDEQLCTAALCEHHLKHLVSLGGCLPGHRQLGPMLHMSEKALFDHGRNHGQGSVAV